MCIAIKPKWRKLSRFKLVAQKINREFGKTILIVEQKVHEVLEVCHHVYLIKLGSIVYSGPPEPLKTDTEKMKELFL